MKTKPRVYMNLNLSYICSPYLNSGRWYKVAITTSARAGICIVREEEGIHYRTGYEHRICEGCYNVIETVVHILLDCKQYKKIIGK